MAVCGVLIAKIILFDSIDLSWLHNLITNKVRTQCLKFRKFYVLIPFKKIFPGIFSCLKALSGSA